MTISPGKTMNIVLYTSKKDDANSEVKAMLQQVNEEKPFQLSEIDIDDEQKTYSGYVGKTPVLEIGPYHLFYPFTKQDLLMTIGAAQDRHETLVTNQDATYLKKIEKGSRISKSDVFSLWMTRSYMYIFNLLLSNILGITFSGSCI